MSADKISTENRDEGYAGFKHASDQKSILEALKKIKSVKQLLLFAHSGLYDVKSTVMWKKEDMKNASGKRLYVLFLLVLCQHWLTGWKFSSHFQLQNKRCFCWYD